MVFLSFCFSTDSEFDFDEFSDGEIPEDEVKDIMNDEKCKF